MWCSHRLGMHLRNGCCSSRPCISHGIQPNQKRLAQTAGLWSLILTIVPLTTFWMHTAALYLEKTGHCPSVRAKKCLIFGIRQSFQVNTLKMGNYIDVISLTNMTKLTTMLTHRSPGSQAEQTLGELHKSPGVQPGFIFSPQFRNMSGPKSTYAATSNGKGSNSSKSGSSCHNSRHFVRQTKLCFVETAQTHKRLILELFFSGNCCNPCLINLDNFLRPFAAFIPLGFLIRSISSIPTTSFLNRLDERPIQNWQTNIFKKHT